jgi:hypothetical protein
MPQLAASFWLSLHTDPQQTWPVLQAMPEGPHLHWPLSQISPFLQATPQPPQLLASEETSWQPSLQHDALVPQVAVRPPPRHTQLPLLQDSLVRQVFPQAPQFSVLAMMSTQGSPPQQIAAGFSHFIEAQAGDTDMSSLSMPGGVVFPPPPPLLEQPDKRAETRTNVFASRSTEPKKDFVIATLLLDHLRPPGGADRSGHRRAFQP